GHGPRRRGARAGGRGGAAARRVDPPRRAPRRRCGRAGRGACRDAGRAARRDRRPQARPLRAHPGRRGRRRPLAPRRAGLRPLGRRGEAARRQPALPPAPRGGQSMTADEAQPETSSSLVARRSSLGRRRVYLMRHAEVSYFNAAGRPRRPRGVSLTAEGREQAAAAARALAPVPLDRVVISGLPRTVETARIVAGDRPLTPEVRPELREIEGGRLRDVAEGQIEALFTRAFVRIDRATQFLGRETFGALVDRAVPAFRAL